MPSVLTGRARGARPLSLRAARGAALVLAALAAGACGDDDDVTGEDEPENIISVQLTVTPPGGAAAAIYTVRTTGAALTVPVRVGTSAVSAVALDGDNRPITLDEPFELRLVSDVTGDGATQQTPLTGALAFTPSGRLDGGTLVATGPAATVPGFVRLVHIDEAHSDFDARVTFQVTP